MTTQKADSTGFFAGLVNQLRIGFGTVALPFFRPTDMGSFGRSVCTFLLLICYWYSWRFNKDVPMTLLTVLQTMLVYLFGTKIYDGVADYTKTKLNLTTKASVQLGTDTVAGTVVPKTPASPTDDASKDS